MIQFHVPTNKELEANITEKVMDSFAELVFVAESGSYEMRSAFRLLDSFEKSNKKSFGSLLEFSDYCSNVAQYYTNEKAKTLLKQVVKDIDHFLGDNQYFLL